MGLLEQEIKEIRQMLRQFDADKINTEHFITKMAGYNQIEKRVRLMLQAHLTAAKHHDIPLKRIFRSNLIGDGQAIDIDTIDVENELIKCPGLNFELIKRHECLDYSGENKFAECKGCDIGLITKKLLLPAAN